MLRSSYYPDVVAVAAGVFPTASVFQRTTHLLSAALSNWNVLLFAQCYCARSTRSYWSVHRVDPVVLQTILQTIVPICKHLILHLFIKTNLLQSSGNDTLATLQLLSRFFCSFNHLKYSAQNSNCIAIIPCKCERFLLDVHHNGSRRRQPTWYCSRPMNLVILHSLLQTSTHKRLPLAFRWHQLPVMNQHLQRCRNRQTTDTKLFNINNA